MNDFCYIYNFYTHFLGYLPLKSAFTSYIFSPFRNIRILEGPTISLKIARDVNGANLLK